jgi:hypothetical protein
VRVDVVDVDDQEVRDAAVVVRALVVRAGMSEHHGPVADPRLGMVDDASV